MKWKEEYSVGIQEIDDQHKKLLDMFMVVEQSIESAESWNDVHLGLVGLKSSASIHFTVEQALMRLFGYEDLARHIVTHQYFFDKLAEMERRSLGISTKKETVEFLVDWFKDHMSTTDRKYANYILSGAQVVRSKTSSGELSKDPESTYHETTRDGGFVAGSDIDYDIVSSRQSVLSTHSGKKMAEPHASAGSRLSTDL
jgi:hemerythrin